MKYWNIHEVQKNHLDQSLWKRETQLQGLFIYTVIQKIYINNNNNKYIK